MILKRINEQMNIVVPDGRQHGKEKLRQKWKKWVKTPKVQQYKVIERAFLAQYFSHYVIARDVETMCEEIYVNEYEGLSIVLSTNYTSDNNYLPSCQIPNPVMSSQSATPSAPLFFSHTPGTQLLLHSALSSAELFAAFTPPVYLISTLVLRRRPISIRRLMYNSMGGVLAGAAVGGGYAYLRGWRGGELKVRERVARVVGSLSLSFFLGVSL